MFCGRLSDGTLLAMNGDIRLQLRGSKAGEQGPKQDNIRQVLTRI